MLLEHNHEKIYLFTDGSKDNEGVGLGVYGNNLKIQIALPQKASIFTAELLAIKNALRVVREQQIDKVTIFSDSLSSIEAINSYQPQNEIAKEIRCILSEMKSHKTTVTLCWVPSHIGIEGNEKADEYAKEAKNLPISEISLPLEDYLRYCKSVTRTIWQNKWNEYNQNNKLNEIKETINPWPSSLQKVRRNEVVLTRLRIGHCRLTHGYLMNSPHYPQPICDTCNTQITVKHVLIECPEYSVQRNLLFRRYSLKEILSENEKFSLPNLLKFLKFYNLFDKI